MLGSRAANDLGLTIGDTFRAAHGLGSTLTGDLHENVYTVVGILQSSGTPYDNAVYTTINTVWQVHETEEADALSPFVIGEAGAIDRLTSVLVQPVGFVEQNQLWQEYYTRTDAQAVFPGQELGALFDLLRQGEQILTIVGYLVFGIAALTVFLSIYGTTVSREREIAIMRSLGGKRSNVFRMVIFETLILTVVGSLLGRVLGYGLAWVIATVFSQRSAIPIPITYLTTLEPLLWLLPLGVGVLAGLLPAAMAYRVDVVEKLTA
jgi:putative ABC transport system permease protein